MQPTADARAIRRLHRTSVVAGAIVLALSLLSIATRPTPCGGLPASYPPIVAFELARSGPDLHAIFGAKGGECRAAMVEAMDRANVLDLAIFIPAYGLFLLAAFAGLGRRGRPGAPTGVAMAVVAMVGDVAENACLMRLTPELDASAGSLKLLPWVTAVKWLALGAAGAAAAVALWPGAGRRHRVAAGLCLLAPLATLAATAAPHRFGPALATGVAVSWLMLLVDGVVQARAPLPPA